jgi:molybdate transport system substrate-binding protein
MIMKKQMIIGCFVVCVLFPLVFSGVLGSRAQAADEKVTVFAAASTTNALTDIGKVFMEKKMGEFMPSFASSSTLAKQIENGAPANIFLSADLKWMDYLAEKKMIDPASRVDLLGNRLVFIVPADSKLGQITVTSALKLSELLADGKLAMGDPDHVPVGIYGKKALESLGLWAGIQDRVARTNDVRAALTLVERGEAPLGIVYSTDAAISDMVKVIGVFPEDSHPPIVYPVAAVAGQDTPATRRFLSFLKGPEAKAIFEKYGFSVR